MESIKMNTTAGTLDLINELVLKTQSLDAMLAIVTGEGFEAFTRFNEGTQHEYIFACSEMASQVREITDALSGKPVLGGLVLGN